MARLLGDVAVRLLGEVGACVEDNLEEGRAQYRNLLNIAKTAVDITDEVLRARLIDQIDRAADNADAQSADNQDAFLMITYMRAGRFDLADEVVMRRNAGKVKAERASSGRKA